MLRRQRIIFDSQEPNVQPLYLVEREHTWNGQDVARSHVLVCPFCFRVWARLVFEDDKVAFPVGQFCREHTGYPYDRSPVPGSLLVEEGWGNIDTELLERLPEILLRREFELHLRAYT